VTRTSSLWPMNTPRAQNLHGAAPSPRQHPSIKPPSSRRGGFSVITHLLLALFLFLGVLQLPTFAASTDFPGTSVYGNPADGYFLDTYIDSSESGPIAAGKVPLILIHGINIEGVPAPEQTEKWDNFLRYFYNTPSLSSRYQIYRFGYTSNNIPVGNIAHDLANCLEQATGNIDHGFGSRNIVIVAHSMGGLIARRLMELQYPNSTDKWYQHITKLITLATPHHGTPIANECVETFPSSGTFFGALGNKLAPDSEGGASDLSLGLDALHYFGFFNGVPTYNQVNRADLLWDNYDNFFAGGFDMGEDPNSITPPSTASFNRAASPATFDKIIAYAGCIDPLFHAEHWQGESAADQSVWTAVYMGIASLLEFGLDRSCNPLKIDSDGVVPLKSAYFDGVLGIAQLRCIPNHDHSEMWLGRSDCNYLFDLLRRDLEFLLTTSATPPLLSVPADATAIRGQTLQIPVTADSSQSLFLALGLPLGLTQDARTGLISGIPATIGIYPVTLIAINSAGASAARTFTLTVSPPSHPTPDIAPQNVTLDSYAVQAGATVRVSFSMSNQGTATAGATTTRIRLGASSTVTTPLDAVIGDISTPSIAAGGTIALNATLSLPARLAPGTYYIWAVADNLSALTQLSTANDYARSRALTVTSASAAPVIASALTASGTQSRPLSYTIVAANSPATYSSGSLPIGLNLSGNVISGTPSVSGTFPVTIGASNASGSDSATLVLNIAAAPARTAAPVISPGSGSYGSSVLVSLSCSTPGSSIRFTTDGSDPTLVYQTYTGPFTLTNSTTVKAKAVSGSADDSEVVASNFTVLPGQPVVALGGSLAFNNVLTGTSWPGVLAITNNGDVVLSVTGITLPNGYSGNWSGDIAAGQTQYVGIQFTPTAAMTYDGTIIVNSNGAGVNSIPVHGTGTSISGPAISLSGSLDFGNVPINTSAQRTLTISNPGSGPLYVSSLSYPDPGFSGTWSGTIAAGQSQDVTITFAPTATRSYSGTMAVNSTASSGNPTPSISGTGTTTNYAIALATSPAGAGIASGGGSLPVNSQASVTATANPGFTFQNWTENGTVIGTSANLSFTVTGDRTLVANFTGQPATYSALAIYNQPAGTPVAPGSPLLVTAGGDLYGTSFFGGANSRGFIFKVSPSGMLTTLYDLTTADGANPSGGLTNGPDGRLYGVTNNGGASGSGTLYAITLAGDFSTIHSFAGGSEGATPSGELAMDGNGYLYGATRSGGAFGNGTLFQLSSAGAFATLHSFNGTSDGGTPVGGVTVAQDNTVWGVTSLGGTNFTGTIYKIDSAGNFAKAYDLTDTSAGGLLLGADLNFYGVTANGLNHTGTIFKFVPIGATYTTVYPFSALSGTTNADGSKPNPRLISGPSGYLYGTTRAGGAGGTGTVFKLQLTPSISLTTLHSFSATTPGSGTNADGAQPLSGVSLGLDGNLYGMASLGGANAGGTIYGLYLNGLPSAALAVQSAPVAGGSATGGGNYPVGQVVSIAAAPAAGWDFAGWNDGSAATPRNVTVPLGGATYTAHFTQQMATLVLAANPAGSGSVGGAGSFGVGTSQAISATPNVGWIFQQWSDGITQNPRSVIIPAGGATYTATFLQQQASLLAIASPASAGDTTGSGVFAVGSSQPITAAARSGWIFAGWADGISQSQRTVALPLSGATFVASFAPALNFTALTLSGNGLTLQGVFNPNGSSTTAYLEYGTNTNYGSSTSPQSLGNGGTGVNFQVAVTGLLPNTVYHIRPVIVVDGVTTYGSDQTFSTTSEVPAFPKWAGITLGSALLIMAGRRLRAVRL
jgi:uncharacterized repeat protein (TIGR02543 family)